MYLFKNYKEARKWGAIELFVGMPYILGSAKVNITEVCDKTIVENTYSKNLALPNKLVKFRITFNSYPSK